MKTNGKCICRKSFFKERAYEYNSAFNNVKIGDYRYTKGQTYVYKIEGNSIKIYFCGSWNMRFIGIDKKEVRERLFKRFLFI